MRHDKSGQYCLATEGLVDQLGRLLVYEKALRLSDDERYVDSENVSGLLSCAGVGLLKLHWWYCSVPTYVQIHLLAGRRPDSR